MTPTDAAVSLGAPVTFTGTFVDPGALDPHIIRWNFGASTLIAVGQLPRSYLFAAAGTYAVSLTVSDDDGGAG